MTSSVVQEIYYTSDSLWKISLVESIQSIHNSLWTWHYKCNIAFIMSSSTSALLLSPLERSPQKQNGWTLRFCFWGWILWKMCNKTIFEFGFRMISWIMKTSCLCYLPQPSASADNTDLGFDNSWYHAQPHPIIVYFTQLLVYFINNNEHYHQIFNTQLSYSVIKLSII